ncbi:MAG: glycosyltransferase [candidate division WOR-3 bacterium]
MRLLFITFFFPPYNTIGAVRTGKTAKILHELGFEVRVVAGVDNSLNDDLPVEIPEENVLYAEYFDFEGCILRLMGKDKYSVKNVLHSGYGGSFRSRVLKGLFSIYRYIVYIPDKYIGWYPFALPRAEGLMVNWKPDVILASAMPYTSLLVAAKLSRKYDIPFVAELRDLWVDNHYIKHNPLSALLERKVLNQASAIITVSQPLVEKLRKRYDKPIYEIMNGFDEEDFPSTYAGEELENNNNKTITITYTGMIYPGKQDPSLLFRTISCSEELKKIIVCRFYGNNLEWLKYLARDYKIEENIQVYPPVSRKESLRIQSESDVLLLLTWNDPSEKGVYTGKIFEYIGNAKPILVIGSRDNVAAELVRENGFGIVADKMEEVEEFLLNLQEKYVPSIKQNYLKNRYKFERRKQLLKLAEVLSNISQEGQ